MSPMYYAVIILYALALAAGYFDAHFTAKGIKSGVGTEKNPIYTFFVKDKPTFNQLMVVDYAMTTLTFAVSFIPGPKDYPHTWVALSIGMLVSTALSHIRGAREWKWAIAHPTQVAPEPKKWWQQFLGFWG